MGKAKNTAEKVEEVKTVDSQQITVDSPAEELVVAFEAEQKRLLDFLKEKNLIKEGENIVDAVIKRIEGDAFEMGEAATALKGIGAEIEKTKAENISLSNELEAAKLTIQGLAKESESNEIDVEITGRLLMPGTKLQMANETVTLESPAFVNFPGEESEQKFVGMCVLSGNLEANRQTLEHKYDGLGNREPVEQPDEETEE